MNDGKKDGESEKKCTLQKIWHKEKIKKERFKECSGVRKCIYIRNDSKSRNSRTWYQNRRHAKGMEETNAKICRKQIARPPISVEGLWGYEEAECHKWDKKNKQPITSHQYTGEEKASPFLVNKHKKQKWHQILYAILGDRPTSFFSFFLFFFENALLYVNRCNTGSSDLYRTDKFKSITCRWNL